MSTFAPALWGRVQSPATLDGITQRRVAVVRTATPKPPANILIVPPKPLIDIAVLNGPQPLQFQPLQVAAPASSSSPPSSSSSSSSCDTCAHSAAVAAVEAPSSPVVAASVAPAPASSASMSSRQWAFLLGGAALFLLAMNRGKR